MLIDFTVENYRSIKESVTLSAVAQSRSRSRSITGSLRRSVKPDNEIAPTSFVKDHDFELLPVLGIFGANASGKSNVVNALDRLLSYMAEGIGSMNNGKGNTYFANYFTPFKLEITPTTSTHFQLRVALAGCIYTYTLQVNAERILLEKLEETPLPPKRLHLLFERIWNDIEQKHIWKNGTQFAGPHIQLEESLLDYQPFIWLLRHVSTAVIPDLQRWLGTHPIGVVLGNEANDLVAASLWSYVDPEVLQSASTLVRHFDTGISDIEIIMAEPNTDFATGIFNPFKVVVSHKTKTGKVRWPLEEESTGTQRLFRLAARIIMALQSPSLVIVDELGSNIHPNVTEEIVRLFQSPKTNPKRAQLIFTSHDNTLQRGNLLRRDQIWFTQKRSDGSTELYPLTDFKPRNDLAIDKAYLDGRFGAVPILPAEDELLPAAEVSA